MRAEVRGEQGDERAGRRTRGEAGGRAGEAGLLRHTFLQLQPLVCRPYFVLWFTFGLKALGLRSRMLVMAFCRASSCCAVFSQLLHLQPSQ